MAEVEIRSAQVADVSFPKRQIELIVMPYETMAEVEYHGRMIEEIVSRGAFDGLEKPGVASRVKVNLDHKLDIANKIGSTLALHPSRQEGLVGEVRVSKMHPLGNFVLEQADAEDLGASAGFTLLFDKNGKTYPNAQTWETRRRRRLNRLFLDHIALTPDPAYVGARVLAVRNASETEPGKVATPNLDAVRAQLLHDRWAALDAVHRAL